MSEPLKQPEPAARLRETALLLLGRREHSARELAGKLASRFSLPAGSPEIHAVLSSLQASAYQSDERFTEIFVRDRRSRGYGPARIEQELRLRGINDELIALHVERNHPDWGAVALAVRQKRFGADPVPALKDRARISRFLHYRGFLQGQIQQAL